MKKEKVRVLAPHRGIKIAAVLMMFFGFAEVVTSMTGRFLVLTYGTSQLAAGAGVVVGLLYFSSGLLILRGQKWAAFLAISFLVIHIAGRVMMIVMGLYLANSIPQIIGIVTGTAVAVYLTGYIGLKIKSFR